MKKLLLSLTATIVFLIPTRVLADAEPGTIQSIIDFLTSLLSRLLEGLLPLGIVVFFWGLSKYIYNGGDIKKEQEGRSIMTWGVIAIFVSLTIYGIISYLDAFFGSPEGPKDLNIVVPKL